MSVRFSIEGSNEGVKDCNGPSSNIVYDDTAIIGPSVDPSKSNHGCLQSNISNIHNSIHNSMHGNIETEIADNESNLQRNGRSKDYSFMEDIDNADNDIVSKKDLKSVRNVKILILFALLTSVCGAMFVYYQNLQSERLAFEHYFQADSSKILSSIAHSISTALGTLDNMATSVTYLVQFSNQKFPFVTLAEFGVLVAKAQQRTGAVCTYLLPVVSSEERQSWEIYASKNSGNIEKWFDPAIDIQENYTFYYGPKPQRTNLTTNDALWSFFEEVLPYNMEPQDDGRLDIHLPDWIRFPAVAQESIPLVNWDWYSQVNVQSMTRTISGRNATMSAPSLVPNPNEPAEVEEALFFCEFYKNYIRPDAECMEPMATIYYPILSRNQSETIVEVNKLPGYPREHNVEALIALDFYWKVHLQNLLPSKSIGVIVVFENESINATFTYRIDGPKTIYMGAGDHHDPQYNYLSVHTDTKELQSFLQQDDDHYIGVPFDYDNCIYKIHIYASDDMKKLYMTNKGIIFACSAVLFIFLPFLAFLVYERKMSHQQSRIISDSKRKNAIVSSLFPAAVRDKLMSPDVVDGNLSHSAMRKRSTKRSEHLSDRINQPIAELYTDTTVLFADIANFTVWASARDPNQVFILLESIYGPFDQLARRRNVFKVETIGDCYVAATGLPEPRQDHAVAMVDFARDIVKEMSLVVAELETILGPGTAALTIRVGLNSGPTTAGVLRGEKGRFQLFGDTVNTAARMQTNSLPGKIMCSQKTRELLVEAGKEDWTIQRDELVEVKGKGKMHCYWITQSGHERVLSRKSPANTLVRDHEMDRQVSWLSETFVRMINDLLKEREIACATRRTIETKTHIFQHQNHPRDEVTETINLQHIANAPAGSKPVSRRKATTKHVITPEVTKQIIKFVEVIANRYKNNPFHNFKHACHVAMATKKMLSRIATSCELSSDGLTQIAILFSALIHDVDHPGVSNAQLCIEKTEAAMIYDCKSVSEQNSISIAWDIFMEKDYEELRALLLPTDLDKQRFRQVVVNCVSATDLFDPDLRKFRDTRWLKAFGLEGNKIHADKNENTNRRIAIIMELIIQASDISHTMQHWHVYQEWNHKLFYEMYDAFQSGRLDKDPSVGWYEGELWFFDNYIIPLAHKLRTCNVFGVSCDELLDYAVDNRVEWALKGKDIVKTLVETYGQHLKKSNHESALSI